MQVFSHTLKDNYSPRNTIPNQRSYISDFKVETKSNKYPVVSLIVVPLDIKKLIDSKSLNLMDILELSKIKDKFSISDIIGLLSVQNIVREMLDMNTLGPININKTSVEFSKPSSDPKHTDDVYGRIYVGGEKVIDDRTPVYCGLRDLWDNEVYGSSDENLRLYYRNNLDPELFQYNAIPSDIIDFYNNFLFDKNNDVNDTLTDPNEPLMVNEEPYRFVLGYKRNTSNQCNSFIYQPVFLILEPGAGSYLNVSENREKFLSEYIKIHYGLMPIQTVSTLDLFKRYFKNL